MQEEGEPAASSLQKSVAAVVLSTPHPTNAGVGVSTVQGPQQPVEGNPTLETLLKQFLSNNSAAGPSTILSHPAPILEKLSWDAVKVWTASYRTFLSQTGRSDHHHPSKSISFHCLRTAKAYWEIEQSKPLLASIGKWEEAIATDPLNWLANFELVIKAKQGVSTSSKVDLSLRTDKDGPLAEEFFEKFSDYIAQAKSKLSEDRIIEIICKAIADVYPRTGERLKAEMLYGKETSTPESCLKLALAELSNMRKAITDHNRFINNNGNNNSHNNNHNNNNNNPNPSNGKQPGSRRPEKKKRNDKDDNKLNSTKDNSNNEKNKGDELGNAGAKLKCWICNSEDHLKDDCPEFDPNYKTNKKGKKKAKFSMIRRRAEAGLFSAEFVIKAKIGEPVIASEYIVQFDTGAEDGNSLEPLLA